MKEVKQSGQSGGSTGKEEETHHRTRQHGNIEQAISSGGKVVDIAQHEQNENLTVVVRMPDSDEDLVFTNVKPEHVEELKKKYPNIGKPAKSHHLKKGEHPTKFIDMIKEPGAEVCDWHPTERGTYSIHIRTSDGQKHAYSSISEAHMIQYVSDFEPNTTRGRFIKGIWSSSVVNSTRYLPRNMIEIPNVDLLGATLLPPESPAVDKKPDFVDVDEQQGFEMAMAQGGIVKGVRHHDNNQHMTVLVHLPDGDEIVFTDLTPAFIEEVRLMYPAQIPRKPIEGIGSADDEFPGLHGKAVKKAQRTQDFLNLMSQPGSVVVCKKRVRTHAFAVNVKDGSGKWHGFTDIAEAHLKNFE
ncbi:hypothetical protein HDU76_001439 [Blyttiomyces sp. JEL0837]|nr:hypothetical protein HDU76_001439 [Blyttiomyces sp. JEL0837]